MAEGSRRLEVRALEVVLKGGSPWGFSLKGGSEIRSALTVSKVEEDGKADGLLEAGDILLSINDVHCRSRAEAIQLVKSAFKTLTLTVWRGSVESSTSSPSPSSSSFLKKAQEIKDRDKERDKERDSKENIPVPKEEETTKRNSIEVQVRSPSSRSRVRPRSWHPVGGDGDTTKLTLAPLDDSSLNELSSQSAHAHGAPFKDAVQDSPFTSPTRTLAEVKESASEAEYSRSNNNVRISNNNKTLTAYHSAYDLSDYPEEDPTSANKFLSKDSEGMKGTSRRSYGGMPTRSMHSAYSTPNLGKEESDRSRLSMYNALNTRSGYNFLPTKQQQQGPWESNMGSWDTRQGAFEESPRFSGYQHSQHSIQYSRGPNYRRPNNNNSDYENLYRTEYHIDVDHSRYADQQQEQPPEVPPPPREADLVDSSQPLSPPMPPVRDASSLKYFKASQSLEGAPQQWTPSSMLSPQESNPPESPSYISATRTNNSWSEQADLSKNGDFSKHSRGGVSRSYDPKLHHSLSDVTDNKPVYDLKGQEDILKSPKEPELRAGNVHRATVAKVHAVEEERKLNSTFPLDAKSSNTSEIQTENFEYQPSMTYPIDSKGRRFEDEDYTVPSPPQRDIIVKQNGGTQTEPQEERKSFSDLLARFEIPKNGSKSGSVDARPRTVAKSASTSTLGSQRSQQIASPLNENDSYTYIVRNKPYYNTSTQTDDIDTDPMPERQQLHRPQTQNKNNNKLSSSKSESSIKKHAEVQVDTDFTGVYHALPVMSSSGTQVDPESPTLKTTQATTSTQNTAPAGTTGHGAIYHENEPYRRIQAWMQHAENHKLSDVSSGYKSDDGASRLAKSMTDIADEEHYADEKGDHVPTQNDDDQVNSDSTLVNSKVEIDEPKSSDNDNDVPVIPYHSYSDSTAPMLRKLSAEMYKQQMKEQKQYEQLQQEQLEQQQQQLEEQDKHQDQVELDKTGNGQQQDVVKYAQQQPADVSLEHVQEQQVQDKPEVLEEEKEREGKWANNNDEAENDFEEDYAKEVSESIKQQSAELMAKTPESESTPVAPKRKKREERLRIKQEKLKQEQEHLQQNQPQEQHQFLQKQNHQTQQQHTDSASFNMQGSRDPDNHYNRGRHSLGEPPRDRERDSPVSPTRKASVMKAYGIYDDSYENNSERYRSKSVPEQVQRSSQSDHRSHSDPRSPRDQRSHRDSRSHGEGRQLGESKLLGVLPEEQPSRSRQRRDEPSQYQERGVDVRHQREIPPEQDRRRRPYQASYYEQDQGRNAYENIYQQDSRHGQPRSSHPQQQHHHAYSKSMQHPHRIEAQDSHHNPYPVSHGRSHSASSLQPGPAPQQPQASQQPYPSQYDPKPLGQIAEVNESRGSDEFDRDHWKNHLDRMAKDLSKVPHERYRLKRTTSEQIRPIKERDKGGRDVESQRSTDSDRERKHSDPNREPMRVSRGSDPTKEGPREGSKIKRRESDRYDMSRKQRYMEGSDEKSGRDKRISEGNDNMRRPVNPKRRPMSGSVYIGGQPDPNRLRMSDPDQKVQVQQALLNFYEMKTGKRMDLSSGSSNVSEENTLNFTRDRYGTLPPGWKDRTPSPGKRGEKNDYDPLSRSMPMPQQPRPQERPPSQRRTRSGEDPRQYRHERDAQQHPEMLSPSSTSSGNHHQQQQQYRRQESAELAGDRASRRSTSSSTASSHDRSSRSGERPGSLSLPSEEKYPPRMAPLMPQYASVDQADRSDRGSDQPRSGRPQETSTSSSGGASPTKPTDLQRFTFTNSQAQAQAQNTSSSSIEDDKPPLPPRNYKPSSGDRRSQGQGHSGDPHWYPPHMDRRQDRIETRWGDGRQVQNYENLGQEDAYADQLRHQARKLSQSQSQSQPKLVSAPSYIHHGSGTRMNISTSRPVERPQVMNEAHQPKSAFRPVGTSSPKEEIAENGDRNQNIPQPQKRMVSSHSYSNVDPSGRIIESGSHLENSRTNGEQSLYPPPPPPKSYLSADTSGSPAMTPSSAGFQQTPDDVFSEDENRKFKFDRASSSSRERESSARYPDPEPVKGEKPIPKPRQSQLRRRPSLNDGQSAPPSDPIPASTAPPREEKIVKQSPNAVIRNSVNDRESYRNYERLSEATSSPSSSQQQVIRSPNSAFTSTVRYRNGTQESKDSGISDMEALSITARIAHLQQSRENSFRPIEKISPPKSNVAEISAKFGGSRDNLHLIGRESSPEANEEGDSSRNNSHLSSSAQRVNNPTMPDRRFSSDRLLYQQHRYEQEQQPRQQQQWYDQQRPGNSNYSANQQMAPQDSVRHRPADLDLRQQQQQAMSENNNIEKRTMEENSSVLSAPVVSHRRQVSQEELECDVEAQRLAKELREKDEQLSAVLAPSAEMKKTTDYMNGLFETGSAPSGNRRRGADGKSTPTRSSMDEKDTSLNSSDAKMSSPLPPTSPYWSSPETAKLENRMREEGISKDDRLKDICSDPNDLEKKKEELIDRMQKKLDILKEEKDQLEEEIRQNNDLGQHVTAIVEQKCRQQSEIDKYKLYIDELVKIMQLLFKLSGRLARAENAVMSLDIDADEKEKSILEEKRDKLSKQHEDAKMLKEGIDRRSNQVAKYLKEYLLEEEFADYQHFVDMKTKLTMDYHELEDNIKLAEEQLDALKRSMEKR